MAERLPAPMCNRGADGTGCATIRSIYKRNAHADALQCVVNPMQNIAELADDLEEAGDIDTCKACGAFNHMSTWTHCGTCDAKLDDDAAHTKRHDNLLTSDQTDADSMIGYTIQEDDTASRNEKKHTCVSNYQKARAGTERLVDRQELTKPSTSTSTSKSTKRCMPQKRVAGSMPVLVHLDEERCEKMKSLARVRGFGAFDSGKEVCMVEFRYLLLSAGYSEGSWKHASECNKDCDRTCAGSCRNDGNPYTYPRFMGIFFDEKVVKTKGDFFVEGVHEEAGRVARIHGIKSAHKSKKWNEVDTDGVHVLSQKGRDALVVKLTKNIMHGFDDYTDLCKSCDNNPMSLMPKGPKKKKENDTHRVLLHDPDSPSLGHWLDRTDSSRCADSSY